MKKMYNKNLEISIHLRLSKKDFEFLCAYSNLYNMSVSDVIRMLVSNYRRSIESISE